MMGKCRNKTLDMATVGGARTLLITNTTIPIIILIIHLFSTFPASHNNPTAVHGSQFWTSRIPDARCPMLTHADRSYGDFR